MPMNRRVSTLHLAIREELHARQMTGAQLAERLGVAQGMVSRWLSEDDDKRVVPLPQVCAQIAEIFEIPALEVFHLAGYLPSMEQPAGPHDDEIRMLTRRLKRILRTAPEPDWVTTRYIVEAMLDGIQTILNRLEARD